MFAAIPDGQTSYSVEVSGWDNNEDFFVEKTELHWSEQSGKHILLFGADRFGCARVPPVDRSYQRRSSASRSISD